MIRGRRIRLTLGGLISLAVGAGGAFVFGDAFGSSQEGDLLRKTPPAELRIERSERAYPLAGVVIAGGIPLDDATVVIGSESAYTDETGTFSFGQVPLGEITVTRPGYLPASVIFDGSAEEVEVPMEVRIVRAIRISSTWAIDDAEIQRLIDLAEVTSVNAFVFDAMGDDGFIDYSTTVQAAIDHSMITDTPYDIAARLEQAKNAGLYTAIRITTFANPLYVKYFPQHALGGGFMDPGNREAWEYPLALAVEVCSMGFDEVNFDYIRYPSNFFKNTPRTQEGRDANIRGFLEEAVNRLHPLGCAVSANSFGGPTMVTNDYGIGQLLEEFTAPIDVYAPMTYPELWTSPGHFGFKDPWNHPKEVVAAQLDSAAPRVAQGAVIRPWLRASFYPDDWIQVQIEVSEERGLGWIMWSAYDSPFRTSSFPAGTTGEG